jgi:murein DD-endopeptidase MepM/ murein hydrolase activator NlpD
MTNVGGANFKLVADDSRLMATLNALPGKVTGLLGQIEARAKTQFSAAGAVAGGAFAQSLIGSIRSGAATGVNQSLSTIASGAQSMMGQAGTNAGTAFAQNLGAAVRSGSASVASSVAATGQATAAGMGRAGQDAGTAFSASLGNSVRQGASGTAGSIVRSFSGVGTSIGNSLRSQLGNVGRGMGERIGQNITDDLMRGVAGVTGVLANIKNLSEFDAASRKASTLTDDMTALKAGAFGLAKELGNTLTATQALNAAEPVLSSGFTKTADVLKILKAAQIGAVGGFSDIQTVADATTTILAGFGLSADKANAIVQQMAGVQNAGKIQVGEYAGQVGKLVGTIKTMGGSFDGAGLSLMEVNGLIANATAKGVRVSSAFDGIRQAMSSVAESSKKASDEAKLLGINFDAATLQSKGFRGILESLAGNSGTAAELDKIAAAAKKAGEAAGGVNTSAGKAAAANAGAEAAKSATTLLKLFGSVEAVAAIAASAGKEGLADLAKAMEVIAKTDAGAAFEKVAGGIAKQSEALGNKLTDLDVKLKSGAFGAVIAQGMSLAGQAIDGFIGQIEKLNSWYTQLTPQSQNFVNIIGGVAAIATGAAVGITAIAAAAALIAPAFTAGIGAVVGMATGMASLLVAVAPIAVPLAAAGAAVYGIAKAFGATNTQAFTAALGTVAVGLAAVFGPAAISAAVAGAAAITAGFGAMAAATAAAMLPLLPWIAAAAGVATALYGLYKVFEVAKPTLDAWANAIGNAAKGAWDGIGKFVSNTGAALSKWGSDFANWIKPALDWFGRFVVSIGNFVGAVVDALAKMVAQAVQPMVDFVAMIGRFIGKMASDGLAILGNFVGNFISGIVEFCVKFGNIISTAFVKIVQTIAGAFNKIASDIGNFIGSALSAIGNFVASVIAAFGRWVQTIPGVREALSMLGRGITVLRDTAVGVFDKIVSVATAMRDAVVGIFNSIGDAIKSLIQGFMDLPQNLNKATESIRQNGIKPPENPPLEQPGNIADPTLGSAPRQPQSNEEEVLVAALDVGNDSGVGALAGAFARRPRRPKNVGAARGAGEGVDVNASVYYPGGGGIEGPTKDNRGRRLLRTDKVVATPGGSLPNGIPYGSTVRVTNPATGLSTEAIARDSGPFAPGRQLDITDAVAKAIGFQGLGKLRLELVRVPDGKDPNAVYQIGEARRFGSDRASNINPGTAISIGGGSGASARNSGAGFVSPFPSQSRSDIANAEVRPVEKFRATRIKNGRRRAEPHQGEDFAAPAGTPVVASYSGKARIESWGKKYGYVLVTTFTDALGREVQNKRAHLDPASVRAALGRDINSGTFDIQAGQLIGKVMDLGRDFFRANPGTRNHLHDEIRVNGDLTNARKYLLSGKGGGGSGGGSNETPQQRAVNAIKTEKENITSNTETRIGQIDRQIAEGRAKIPAEAEKAKLLREQSIALDKLIPKLQSLRQQYPDAETAREINSVTQSINSQGAAAANAARQIKDDARSRAIANIRTALSDATAKTENRTADINRGEAAGVVSAVQAEKDRNTAMQEQYATINKLLPQITALRQQYPDAETRRELDAITQSINSQSTAALNAAKSQAQQPIRLLNTRVDEAKARADRDVANIDNAAKQDGSREAELNALDLKAARLRNLSGELQSARDEAGKLAQELQDPESQSQLSAIVDKLRDIRTAAIEATRVAPDARAARMVDEPIARFGKMQAGITNQVNRGLNPITAAEDELAMRQAITEELETSQTAIQAIRDVTSDTTILAALDAQLDRIRAFSAETAKLAHEAAANATVRTVDGFKSYADQIGTNADRDTQEVKNQRLLGLISEREELEKNLAIRVAMGEQLAQLIPQLELMRLTQTDPGIIEKLNEQIARYRLLSAEAEGAARALRISDQEASILGQTSKQFTTTLQQGFRDVFTSAANGFKGLDGILDGLLNKIADIGLNAIFGAITQKGSFLGGIFGFKDGGTVPGFAQGGAVQNFSAGGAVLGAIQAVDKALTKEGSNAVLAALTPGEQVLEKGVDAPLFRQMVSDGTWQKMRQSYNYSAGGTVAGGARSASGVGSATGTTERGQSATVTVDRINQIDYVSLSQLEQILEVQIPLAARAGAALTERNMSNTAWRQRNGL